MEKRGANERYSRTEGTRCFWSPCDVVQLANVAASKEGERVCLTTSH